MLRNQQNLTVLKQKRYGSFSVSHETIVNLSDMKLTNIQKDILCRGPHFGIPQRAKGEPILCEFELLHRQLLQFTPRSKNAETFCRSSLEKVAYEYANKDDDIRSFSLDREHMKILKELRKNGDVVITRPDKGRATVVMNKTDYVGKMMSILDDATKFRRLGPVGTHDRTSTIETSLNRFLAELRSAKEISDMVFESVKSTGATRPRMYGLPKIHKVGNPLRPILSMIGSPQYTVSKWLCEFLEPVVRMFNTHCVRDTFAFIDLLKEKNVRSNGYMCSFDVVSLFTNVPLEETIDICADALYRNSENTALTLSESSFRKLMNMVTSEVEFSFDEIMYCQVDGVAMGSPLGPVLANIFVGHCESRVPRTVWPSVYCRFVDDSFAWFEEREHSGRLLGILNDIHPALKFTCEHEENGQLPFLDALVMKTDDQVETTVYRKPTFTGLYITWDSYCATKYKVNLVKNLVHRAKRICLQSRLGNELTTLRSIFEKNGYPVDLLTRLIKPGGDPQNKMDIGPKRCPIYLRLPWKGQWSSSMARTIMSVVRSTYYAVSLNVVYSTAHAFNLKKDVLPSQQKSNVIYEFECRSCGSRYVGRTSQRLSMRIRQHVPLHLLTSNARTLRPTRGRPRKTPVTHGEKTDQRRVCPPRKCKKEVDMAVKEVQPKGKTSAGSSTKDTYQSAIARHLAENERCRDDYDDSCFRVLCCSRSKVGLDVLEALYIRSQQPDLCVQRNNDTILKLFSVDCD